MTNWLSVRRALQVEMLPESWKEYFRERLQQAHSQLDRRSASQRLYLLHRAGWERQLPAGQILFHVLEIGSAGQRQYPNGSRKAEYDLGRSRLSALAASFATKGWRKTSTFAVKKRKALIDDLSFPAKCSHIAIPPEAGIAAVLHKRRDFCRRSHLLQMLQGDVAHSEPSVRARHRAPSASPPTPRHRLPSIHSRMRGRARHNCRRMACPDARENLPWIERPARKNWQQDHKAAGGPARPGR